MKKKAPGRRRRHCLTRVHVRCLILHGPLQVEVVPSRGAPPRSQDRDRADVYYICSISMRSGINAFKTTLILCYNLEYSSVGVVLVEDTIRQFKFIFDTARSDCGSLQLSTTGQDCFRYACTGWHFLSGCFNPSSSTGFE